MTVRERAEATSVLLDLIRFPEQKIMSTGPRVGKTRLMENVVRLAEERGMSFVVLDGKKK